MYWLFLIFMEFHEISWNSVNFLEIYQIPVLRAPWSARLLNPCFFLRNIKVSWRVADGWKHKISWLSSEIMKFWEISWIFINSNDFHAFRKISVPQRWYAKKQYFLCFSNGCSAHTPARALQNLIFYENIGSKLILGGFHGICWNLGAESDFRGFEGSLAGPVGKP